MQGIDYALSVICLGCPSNVFRVGMNFNMQHKHIFRDYLVSWKQIIIFKFYPLEHFLRIYLTHHQVDNWVIWSG